jgi:hypothetical protein
MLIYTFSGTTLLPAAQGQSRDSLRCDDVLETCGHYIYD